MQPRSKFEKLFRGFNISSLSTSDAGTPAQIMVLNIKVTKIIISVSQDHRPTYAPCSANAFADVTAVSEPVLKTALYICGDVPMTSMTGRPSIEKSLPHLFYMMGHHMPMAVFTQAMH